MTQYFLTVPHSSADEPTMESMQQNDPAELEAVFAAVGAFNSALQESGALRYAGGLHPPSTARTVDATGAETAVVEEPFVVADEYVGGFWIIEVDNDDEALAWTTRAAEALQGRIEVRALQDPPS
ncbi:MAG TPA: YciI family protein [Microlunatus sp.]